MIRKSNKQVGVAGAVVPEVLGEDAVVASVVVGSVEVQPAPDAAMVVPTHQPLVEKVLLYDHSPLSEEERVFYTGMGQTTIVNFMKLPASTRQRILTGVLGDEETRFLPDENAWSRDRRCIVAIRHNGQGGEFIALVRDATFADGL